MLVIGISIALLTSCARGISSACPPVQVYGAAEQLAVMQELESLPQSSGLRKWIVDYGVMRAQARACAR